MPFVKQTLKQNTFCLSKADPGLRLRADSLKEALSETFLSNPVGSCSSSLERLDRLLINFRAAPVSVQQNKLQIH